MQVARESRKRARRKRADWVDEVKRYRASGLKAAEYAASRGLHAGTLCGWVSKVGKVAGTRTEAERSEPRFLPVRVGGTAGERAHSKRPAEVEVTLRNGWRVRVAGELPPEGLVELLVLLEGEERC
jgi:hypothetical protein